MLEEKKWLARLNFVKFNVLASWFLLLISIRLMLGLTLQNSWFGTFGAVAITFGIFYGALRYTPLRRFGAVTDNILLSWYRKKFFYLSGFACIAILTLVLILTEYGYSMYSDKLVTLQIDQLQLSRSFELLSRDHALMEQLHKNLVNFSPLGIMAITLASTDATLHGYYTKIISYMLAENIEIVAFVFLFKSRKYLFSQPLDKRI